MNRISIALTVVACLAASASAAEAQVTISQTFGPNDYSASRTVHRGNMTMTRSMSRGVLGLYGCNTVTQVRHTPFGVPKSPVHCCH